jgi:iron complex outermembrane receptor protein
MRKLIILYLFNLFTLCGFSQLNDSTSTLKVFTKTTEKEIKNGSFSKNDSFRNISKARNNESLSSVLQNESINYLKSYGPGNISSISTRGGNAQQTALIYNDFVLNNPLNGMADLSAFPMVFFNSIDLIYGLPSSNWGNGGLSGAIILSDESSLKKGFKINLGSTIGSFNQRTSFLKLSLKNSKSETKLKVYHQDALNNYSFLDQDLKLKNQAHSSYKQIALMFENKIYLNDKNTLGVSYFGQKLNREIPPTLYEPFSDATQQDINHRLFFKYKHIVDKGVFSFQSAYYNEDNLYEDSLKSIYGHNPSKSFINQFEFKTLSLKNNLSINLMNSNARSTSLNFEEKVKTNRTSLTTSYIINKVGWKHLFNARILTNKGKVSPLTYSYGLSKTHNKIDYFVNIGKVYRLPSINDLYWNPGGNTELKAEQGYSSDLGFKIKINKRNSIIYFEPNIYSRWIDNWIQWQPNGAYWSPLNIKKVWSRGLETTSKIQLKNRKYKLNFQFKTAYNLSTNSSFFNEDNSIIDKQLIYSPHYKFVTKIELIYKSLSLTYLNDYTGYRFTSVDNNNFLSAFNIGRIFINYSFSIKNNKTSFFYKANNIYNSNYQMILNRPMPLLNHEIGINITINK